MTRNSIEIDRHYFCQEMTSGEKYTGTFRVSATRMEVRLYSFDRPIMRDFDNPVVLRLEDNRIISLHNNVMSDSGTHYSEKPKRTADFQRIVSNLVVVGDDAWKASDPIRQVHFTIEHADDLMLHTERFDAIADAKFGTMPPPVIVELSVSDITIRVWLAASGSILFARPTTIGVRYSIEFGEAASLATYSSSVNCIVQFVSAVMGHCFDSSDVHISRLSTPDLLKAVDAGEYLGDHSVLRIKHPLKPRTSLWLGNAFVHAGDEEELAALIDSLRLWVQRDPEWRNATSLMMRALAFQNQMSGERLLNACKWLEEIPGAGSQVAASQADIDSIAEVAANKASELGLNDYKERITGVIRGQLKSESNGERFERLVGRVKDRFGHHVFDGEVIEHLKQATRFRGRIAHGAFEPSDDKEYLAFAKSTYAMEALCYLLTIKDLQMTSQGASRVKGLDIVANYRRCHI